MSTLWKILLIQDIVDVSKGIQELVTLMHRGKDISSDANKEIIGVSIFHFPSKTKLFYSNKHLHVESIADNYHWSNYVVNITIFTCRKVEIVKPLNS